MKLAINAGHTPASPGASALLDEVACNRPERDRLIEELRARGHKVSDCTAPDAMAYPDELNTQVRLANASGAELAVSLHFNAGMGTGPEVLYWEGNDRARAIASKISSNIARALDLPNRGAKPRGKELGFLRGTSMTALIVETCFLDRSEDCDALARTDWGVLARAIADGVEERDWIEESPRQDASSGDTSGDLAHRTHVVHNGDTIKIEF